MTTLDLLSSLTYDANCARGSLKQCSEWVRDILKRLQNLDESGFDEAQRNAVKKAIEGCLKTLGAVCVAEKATDGIHDTLWNFPLGERLK